MGPAGGLAAVTVLPVWSGRLKILDARRKGLDVPDVKVFIIPRKVQRGGELKTALRAAMDSAGVGVWVLERRSGVSHQTLANLANGKGGVERLEADAIADALGVPAGDLFIHKDGAELVDA